MWEKYLRKLFWISRSFDELSEKKEDFVDFWLSALFSLARAPLSDNFFSNNANAVT